MRIDAEGVLRCPRCLDEWTHIDRVLVGTRDSDHGEDGPGRITTVDNLGNVTISKVAERDLPGRRHHITLEMWCEICGTRCWFEFRQHKGQTQVSTAFS